VQKQEVPKTLFGDLIIRNGAKTISLETSFGDLIIIRNGTERGLQVVFGPKIGLLIGPNFLKNRV
jgi:hypothetical protein